MTGHATGPNRAAAQTILSVLWRAGVGTAYVSPGSRSGPLAAALFDLGFPFVVHPDERGAAFAALGYGAASGRPALLLCTSGSAPAHALPAVMEADRSGVPLVIVSADRPHEARSSGANQTTEQAGLFGGFVRESYDVGPFGRPGEELPAADGAWAAAAAADVAARASCPEPGPVHLNVRFRRPLVDVGAPPAAPDGPFPRVGRPLPGPPDPRDVEETSRLLRDARRPLVVVGPLPPTTPRSPLLELVHGNSVPCVADVTSGLRAAGRDGGAGAAGRGVVAHAALFAGGVPAEGTAPDLVLHFGGVPVATGVADLIGAARRPDGSPGLVQVDRRFRRQDAGFPVRLRVTACPARFASALSEELRRSGPCGSGLAARFRAADDEAAERVRAAAARDDAWAVAGAVWESVPDGDALYLGNSLSVRAVDAVARPGPRDVMIGSQRGVSGIDGLLAAASGFARGSGRRTTLLCGDLAFLHDVSSSLLVRDADPPVVVVVINDDGGGIFSLLPGLPALPSFGPLFSTPHGVRLEGIARSFGLPYHAPASTADLRDALRLVYGSGRSAIVEAACDREETVRGLALRVAATGRTATAADDAVPGRP